MTANEFAEIATDMIQYEKETFQELIENEDWESLKDEIYEYIVQGE